VAIIERQLRLRERLVGAGLIHHQHLFFTASGAPMMDLKYAYWRWQRTLRRLAIRYRKPYMARHTSVSWNLMLGRNPLRVAREHGHRISTMFAVYAAWIEGAVEADIGAIRDAMNRTGGEVREVIAPTAVLPTRIAPFTKYPSTAIATAASPRGTDGLSPGVIATSYANRRQPLDYNLLKSKENSNGKGGTRTLIGIAAGLVMASRHPKTGLQTCAHCPVETEHTIGWRLGSQKSLHCRKTRCVVVTRLDDELAGNTATPLPVRSV
jgi:hypothetical protein